MGPSQINHVGSTVYQSKGIYQVNLDSLKLTTHSRHIIMSDPGGDDRFVMLQIVNMLKMCI